MVKRSSGSMSKLKVKHQAKDYGEIRIFVYGTLKRGHGNNTIITRAGGKFMGYDCVNLDGAAFLDLGGFPAVCQPVAGNDKDTTLIRGELYYGPQEMLRNCDELEGHPHFFNRVKVDTHIHRKKVWMYRLPETWIAEAQDFNESSCWRPSDGEKEFWKAWSSAKTPGGSGLLTATKATIQGEGKHA